jgi:hypothetical protein
MQSPPITSGSPEPEDRQRRPAPSLATLPSEAVKGRILISAQAAEFWGVSRGRAGSARSEIDHRL